MAFGPPHLVREMHIGISLFSQKREMLTCGIHLVLEFTLEARDEDTYSFVPERWYN
jgi:hypothetical protein